MQLDKHVNWNSVRARTSNWTFGGSLIYNIERQLSSHL